MKANILDGRAIALEIKASIKNEVALMLREGREVGLAVILIGDDPASQLYVRSKEKAASAVGISSHIDRLSDSTSEEELLSKIEKLNSNKKVHGILVQLPLPKHIDEKKVIEAITPEKDVDCFHPVNVGRLVIGAPVFYPCTPAGIMELLKRNAVAISGKECVVIGKSNIVGKPMALMLLAEGATVAVCHSKTVDLKAHCRQADIIISAAGKPGLISEDMIKKGAVVVDVGINRLSDGRVVGDVDFEGVSKIAGAITPVPGGVGPMTIAMLMRNTVEAAKKSLNC